MTTNVDWEQERRRASQHSQASLVKLAERAGWVVQTGRGKGSHVLVSSPAARRPVTIPTKVYRRIAELVISQLEEGSSS